MRLERVMGCGLAASALAVMVAGASAVAGCGSSDSSSGAFGGAGFAAPNGGGSSGSQVMDAPLVVDVDPNATLVQTPGNGIGVYVEYESGGHWNISWTCDTSLTGLPCAYVVLASVASGSIAGPANAEGSDGSTSLAQLSSQEVQGTSTTTLGLSGMAFETAPGAVITVNVSLNAPVSFFFVQDGQVNGGYKGSLTNPLMFQPTAP